MSIMKYATEDSIPILNFVIHHNSFCFFFSIHFNTVISIPSDATSRLREAIYEGQIRICFLNIHKDDIHAQIVVQKL